MQLLSPLVLAYDATFRCVHNQHTCNNASTDFIPTHRMLVTYIKYVSLYKVCQTFIMASLFV